MAQTSNDHVKPESDCIARLKARGATLATAESCTGGLIAKRLTDIPGASSAFLGGVVSYTNSIKHKVLNVPQTVLDEYGAVSEPVARAMAEGVRALSGADYAVSVTGLAGPDGDERGNPVGLVYAALTGPAGTEVREYCFGARTREEIRELTANEALSMLLHALEQ